MVSAAILLTVFLCGWLVGAVCIVGLGIVRRQLALSQHRQEQDIQKVKVLAEAMVKQIVDRKVS